VDAAGTPQPIVDPVVELKSSFPVRSRRVRFRNRADQRVNRKNVARFLLQSLCAENRIKSFDLARFLMHH
jgi:hypothetical protein